MLECSGLVFDGLDDYTTVQATTIGSDLNEAYAFQTFTFVEWWKWNGQEFISGSPRATQVMFSKGDCTIDQQYCLTMSRTTNLAEMIWTLWVGSEFRTLYVWDIPDTDWHLWGLTVSAQTDTAILYMDGVQVASVTIPLVGTPNDTAYEFRLGRAGGGGISDGWAQGGSIDGVILLNGVLYNATAMETLYNNGAGLRINPQGFEVGVWHLDEGSGTEGQNSVPPSGVNYGDDLTLQNGTAWGQGLVGCTLPTRTPTPASVPQATCPRRGCGAIVIQ
jgi:hypothetical protein